jgi:hypothetical protein
MKRLKQIIIVTSLALFSACGPSITFEEAQPANTKALSKFPKNVQGNFISEDQASIVTISDDIVLRAYDYTVKTAKDSLPFMLHLRHDTLFSNEGEGSVFATNVKIAGDSIITDVRYTDTLFMITDSSVLKKFKGHYFLNERFRADGNAYSWSVRKLSVEKGVLTITEIGSQKDLDDLRAITEITDTTATKFAPTRKQFKQFLETKDDGDGEKFTRIHNQ